MGEIRYFEDIKDELTKKLNCLEFEKELWKRVEIAGTEARGRSRTWRSYLYKRGS